MTQSGRFISPGTPKSECDQVLTVGNCNRQSDGFFAVVAENAFMP